MDCQKLLFIIIISAIVAATDSKRCSDIGGTCLDRGSCPSEDFIGGRGCGPGKICCLPCSNEGTPCEMNGSEYRCVMSADECGSSQSAEPSTGSSLACCSSDLFPYCCVPQN